MYPSLVLAQLLVTWQTIWYLSIKATSSQLLIGQRAMDTRDLAGCRSPICTVVDLFSISVERLELLSVWGLKACRVWTSDSEFVHEYAWNGLNWNKLEFMQKEFSWLICPKRLALALLVFVETSSFVQMLFRKTTSCYIRRKISAGWYHVEVSRIISDVIT